ncbi:MAG: hypothetical protein ACTHMC_27235 [Pseudobacter sp.]|uniref:hypothetical protein n=1 Tax=Pseudobacter sp. TaxID=2045420 RepID=UPI003F80401B
MKQQLFILIFGLMPFCGFTQIAANAEEWSGTAKFIRTTDSENSDGRSKTTYTIDISITKGYGKASVSYSVDRRIAYKNAGSYTERGVCYNAEYTELALTLSNDGKYYDILMAVPYVEGMMDINNDGSISKKVFGMGETVFQLEHKERGEDIHVLSGEETTKVPVEGGSSIETYIWHFTRGTMPPDLLVLSPEYETWMPEPGKDEKNFGNVIAVGLELRRKDGKPLDVKAKEFFVQLLNTSREPGVTINYPTKSMLQGAYDMSLMTEKVKMAPYFDGQKFTIPSEDGKSGGFYIASFDGGGYTTLEVKAIMEDGSEIKGHYGKPGGPTSIPYPYRKAGSKIAKAWLDANGNPNETDDNEIIPGSPEKGDGLSVYEEYRGVQSEGVFMRLSPRLQELGIRVDKANMPLFTEGISLFSSFTNIAPVICYADEMDESRIFNANSMTHKTGSQYGLYLKPKNTGNVKGEILPASDFKTTRNSDVININTVGIMKLYDSMALIKKLPYSAADDLNSTVAHYLCRGVGMRPHGASGKGEIIEATTSLSVKYLQENGTPITAVPKFIPHLVGGQANDASGDAACIMCMNNKYEWVYIRNGNNITYRKVPILAPGKKLCTSALGTMINNNGEFFGNAQSGRGNCASHMKIKSW